MSPENEGLPTRAFLLFALLLLVASGLQSVFAARITVFNGEPDFVLTLSIVAGILSNGSVGAVTGFAGGLVTSSLVGQTVGTYLVSRTLAGWCAGWATSRLYRANALVVVAGTLAASLLAEIVYVLAAPHLSLGHGLRSSLLGSVWNAVLAYPIMLLLRRCGWGERLDTF